MSYPRQMTAKTLNALKGWPRPNALDFEAMLDPSVTTPLPQGSVGHVNANGYVTPGVGNLVVMPLFSFPASDDPDVQNYGGDPATDKDAWVSINPASPAGNMLWLVAVGAYEFTSTNYNVNGSYPPNTPLTSPTALTGGVPPGQLTPGTLGTNMICGLVSRGVIDNGYGYQSVAFWPVCLPPGA